jgi:hypothetical protein
MKSAHTACSSPFGAATAGVSPGKTMQVTIRPEKAATYTTICEASTNGLPRTGLQRAPFLMPAIAARGPREEDSDVTASDFGEIISGRIINGEGLDGGAEWIRTSGTTNGTSRRRINRRERPILHEVVDGPVSGIWLEAASFGFGGGQSLLEHRVGDEGQGGR